MGNLEMSCTTEFNLVTSEGESLSHTYIQILELPRNGQAGEMALITRGEVLDLGIRVKGTGFIAWLLVRGEIPGELFEITKFVNDDGCQGMKIMFSERPGDYCVDSHDG